MPFEPLKPGESLREIPNPGFSGDDGSTAAAVTSALAAFAQDPAARYQVLAAVQASRVLVPVVAILGEVEHDEHGHAREKTSDMATVLITAPDGRTGMLAFTSMDAMAAWDPQARPVAAELRTAAASGIQDGASALILDLAGPQQLVIEGDELTYVADGLRLIRVDESWAWAQLEG
ncbi:MAG TPA: SseB family protein [Marmoricola sp.]|nr:SseB family protein [Marmoricola sp.]